MSMAQQTTGTAAWMRATAGLSPTEGLVVELVEPLPEGIRHIGRRIESADRAILPKRCVCCGDTLELRCFRTIPGRVHYFVCREHLISAIARIAIGLAMIAIAGWAIAAHGVSGRAAQLAFGLIGLSGVGMAWFAIPLRAGRSRKGWRTLHGLCRATAQEIE